MYKIGDFSKMSKTTIKALRYYEKEGLLKPAFIDQDTSYRYYESSQLVDISKIISLRQIGLSIKDIPSYIIYYRDGMVEDFSKITEFVLQAGTECAKANPNLKCINPDYCYISYLDGEYKEKDIKIRYAQAVEKLGNETDKVKFMKSNPITAVCIYHKGAYNNLRDSYNIILKYIEDNGYEIIDNARECYIDGCWNKEKEEDYLTEIQFPVKKR